MQGIRAKILHEHTLVFMFCLAVMLGPAISTLFAYDLTQFKDSKTYLALAHFNLDQNPVRRYRVLIPFAAASLNYCFGGLFARFAPAYFTGDFALPFSFFIVNTSLMAWFGLLIYRYCRSFGVSRIAAIVGLLVMLTCRYTAYTAALPLVDSLFCMVVALTLLGIRQRNKTMMIAAIFLGPFAKESFVFIAPLIFFFGDISKGRQLVYFGLSGFLVFGYRYLYDRYAPPATAPLVADIGHFRNVARFLPELFSFHGIYKVLMNPGLWIMVPVALGIADRTALKTAFLRLDKYLFWFMAAVLLQMLLSGSLERMFYLAMPAICAFVALCSEELRKHCQPTEK